MRVEIPDKVIARPTGETDAMLDVLVQVHERREQMRRERENSFRGVKAKSPRAKKDAPPTQAVPPTTTRK